jgi:hypothetical protein
VDLDFLTLTLTGKGELAMNSGVAAISGIALVVAAWLWWHRDAPKICTLLALIAGLGIAGGVSGVLGRLPTQLLHTAGATTGGVTGLAPAAIVTGLAVVAALEVGIKGVHPRKAKPRRWHPFLAMALPTIVIASGVPLLTGVMHTVSGGIASAGSAMTSIGVQ